jgi:N-acetylmuramoyl-L-alanine amidase
MSDRIDHSPAAAAATGLSRRTLLKFAGASLTLLLSPVGHAAGTSLLAVRVWPAPDYTRVTLEAAHELRYKYLTLQNPDRLVIDLEGVALDSVLESLPSKVLDSDPYIRLVRAAQNRPGVVRVVLELKAEIKPQVFTLEPVGDYGHRLTPCSP